jgi:hypothetical protein
MPEPANASAIIDILSRSKRVLVTTHVRPDGDAGQRRDSAGLADCTRWDGHDLSSFRRGC